MLVVSWLVLYSILQATKRPFKLSHESTLDSTSVLLLVVLYCAHIGSDQIEASGLANADVFFVAVLLGSSLTLVLMTVRGRYITKRLIRCLSFQYPRHVPRSSRAW